MGNSASTSEWYGTFNIIKTNHDKAYRVIEEAITLEEQEKPNEAIEKYKEGIHFIDSALSVQVTMPESADFRWEQACRMIQKMKRTRGEVLTRIQCIQSDPNFIQHEPPPPYDEAVGGYRETPQMYKELTSAANELAEDIRVADQAEIIYAYDNVKLYFISPDGSVCQTLQPQKLIIGLIESHQDDIPVKHFLQVGNWYYPLVPGVSLCYRTDYGAFIFPDTESEVHGSSVGIILPSEADPSVYEILENILHGIIGQTPSLQDIRKDVSEQISEKIVSGAAYLSEGLLKGARKASNYINNKTPELMQKITPDKKPRPIPKTVSKTLEVANSATSAAAQVTNYLAEKVGSATLAVGNYLAPHIQNQGEKILKCGFKMNEEEAKKKMNTILTVAAGAVEGFSTLYRGLEASASILGKNLSENTIKIVEHKYGPPAGELATKTLSTGGNAWTVYSNTKILTPKGFVKTTAKSTGNELVKEKRNSLRQEGEIYNGSRIRANDLQPFYPDLEDAKEMEQSTPRISTNIDYYSKNKDDKVSKK